MNKERGISLGVLVFAMVYLAGSLSLEMGTIIQPGPGMAPAIFAVLLVIFAGINLYKAFRVKEAETDKSPRFNVSSAGIVVMLFIYPIILETLNFLVATFITVFVLFRLFKYKTWLHSLVFSLVIVLLAFIAFANLLGVVLPSGPIEDLLLRL